MSSDIFPFDGAARITPRERPKLSGLFPEFRSLNLAHLRSAAALAGVSGTDATLIKGDQSKVVRTNCSIHIGGDRKHVVDGSEELRTAENKRVVVAGRVSRTTLGSTVELFVGSVTSTYNSEQNILQAAAQNRQQLTDDLHSIRNRTTNTLSDTNLGARSASSYSTQTLLAGNLSEVLGVHTEEAGNSLIEAGSIQHIAASMSYLGSVQDRIIPATLAVTEQDTRVVELTTTTGIQLGPNQFT